MTRLPPPEPAVLAASWAQVYGFLRTGCGSGYPCLWFILAAGYGILAIVAAVQLLRIQVRLGEFGWTMQKLFHLFNFVMCVLRAVSLWLWNDLDKDSLEGAEIVLFDLPDLVFFTTYTLLILFWAEIVHAARAKQPVPPRAMYLFINVASYVIEAIFWIMGAFKGSRAVSRTLSTLLQVLLSVVAGTGFLVYGWRLLWMLKRAPDRTPVRARKIQEVGLVTVIAVMCFATKAVLFCLSARDQKGLDFKSDLLINLVFFGGTEILVIASSLGILSSLPPRRRPNGYREIPGEESTQRSQS